MTAPAAPATTVLSGEISVDVVVIGAGYTGLSSALHLALEGTRVAVLEANEIGFGGAGRNVGLVNAGMWVMPDALGETLGADYGERLIDLLGNGPKVVFDIIERHGIDCEAVRSGTLHCAVGDEGLRELEHRAEQWQRRGAAVELLDQRETARLVGSTAYVAALIDRRAGTIQPLAYARGLARAAIAAGATIFTGSAATSFKQVGNQWRVQTANGAVTADWIVVGTDAYGTGPWLPIRREQVHLPYFNLATKPLSDNVKNSILPERQGAWDTKEILSSFRFDRAGRLVFGSVGALRNSGIAIHKAWAKRAMSRLFPQIGEIEFEAEWYGKIGMTSDNLPRFHQLDRNVIAICGYNGRGIAPGTTFGRVIAEHVLGRLDISAMPLPVSPIESQPFIAARQFYYEAGAQAAHLVSDRF
jgi:glycine/D-amino acid oxidase-like deaminating enzyme